MFEELDQYIQNGYKVSFDIVDQIENGNRDQVDAGTMKLYSYTFYLYEPNCVDFIESFSTEDIEYGFHRAIYYLKLFRKEGNK